MTAEAEATASRATDAEAWSREAWRRPGPLLGEAFVAANVAFLSVDVYLAHAVNRFRHPAEIIPVGFGGVAAALLVVTCLRRKLDDRLGMAIGWLVGGTSTAVGVAGMVLHLHDSFFARQTLENLVYTAPFAAPLSYVGLGLMLLLNRMESGYEWARWVVFFALGGFVGTFALALADHAQNGFFYATEWIPVFTTALAVGFLAVPVASPRGMPLVWCGGVVGLQAAVGALGFVLHGVSNIDRPGETVWDAFLFGAPIFAPLLMCDLALLAGLGLWGLARSRA